MPENYFDIAERNMKERADADRQRKHELFMKMVAMLEEVESISSASDRYAANLNAINWKVRRFLSDEGLR